VTASGQHYWTLTRWIGGFVFGGLVVTQIRDWVAEAFRWRRRGFWVGESPCAGTRSSSTIARRRGTAGFRELPDNPLKQGQAIVIVAQTPVDVPKTAEYRAVSVLQGDPSSEKSLGAARLAKARSVTLVSAWPKLEDHDRRRFLRDDAANTRTIETLRIIDSVRRHNDQISIRAELHLRKNEPAARKAVGIRIEIIYAEDLRAAAA